MERLYNFHINDTTYNDHKFVMTSGVPQQGDTGASSNKITSFQPNFARWYAHEHPTTPPPNTITFAVLGIFFIVNLTHQPEKEIYNQKYLLQLYKSHYL